MVKSAAHTVDAPTNRAVERRALGGRVRLALALPLVGRLALGRPGVDAGDLVLERGVDEAVPLEGVERLKGRGDDEGCEGLAAAAWFC